MNFSKFSKMQMFLSTQSYLLFLILTFNRYHCQIVSRLSVIVDLWNVFINFNFLKLRSTVLRPSVICKPSLRWPQAPFQWWLKAPGPCLFSKAQFQTYNMLYPDTCKAQCYDNVINPIMTTTMSC